MNANYVRYFDILEIMLGLMRELTELGRLKSTELVGGRLSVAVALQEREEAAAIKLRIIQDELERVTALLGAEMALDRPADVVDIAQHASAQDAQRLKEYRRALTAEAARVRAAAQANDLLLYNTMLFTNALLGAVASAENSAYTPSGSIAMTHATPSVSGRV